MSGLLEKLQGKRWVRWVGYPAFFQLAFLVCLHLTFPYDALRDRLADEARAATGMDVEIGKVRLAGLSGIELRDVILSEPGHAPVPAAAEEGEEPIDRPPAKRIALDSVTAKADVMAMIRGQRAMKFAARAFGGSLNGRFRFSDDESIFLADAKGLDFAQSPLLPMVGLDLDGTLDRLQIELRSPGPDFSKADGKVQIQGADLVLNGGEVQHFELPKIVLGTLDGTLQIEKGEGNFETFSIQGDDLEARVEGNVRMGAMLSQSTLTGRLKIKPSDDWWGRNELLKTAANFALPAQSDGFRTLTVYGPVSKLNFRPQK